MFADSKPTVICWAMGITQHRNAVATIQEIVNVALLQGNIGKPGAGLCPVRGHSNVQGDRTMGIWERPPQQFLDALADGVRLRPAARARLRHGRRRSARCATARRRCSSGWAATSSPAAPDTESPRPRCAAPPDRAGLHQAQPLARGDRRRGADPADARPHRAGPHRRAASSSSPSRTRCRAVHASRGPLEPASAHLRSEVDIVCALAEATLGDRHGIPWHEFRADYTAIRRHIARVVPGFDGYDEKVDRPGGFVLPHPPRDSRTFPTEPARAMFTVSPLDVLHVPEGRLLLQTLRCHDQFNTTIYGLDDRYRGIHGGRRVVFVHPDDIAALGFADGEIVDLVSEWTDGSERARAGVPDRRLRHAPRLRGGLLPGDQRAGAARLDRRRQQLPDVEVDHRPAGARVRRRRLHRYSRGTGGSTDAKSGVEPHQLS